MATETHGIEQELAKLRFHVKQLGEAIDDDEHPVTAMVIELNWSEEDLERAHDIFEKYDNQLESHGRFFEHDLEKELKDSFDIGYQTVKTIVLAFWRNHQWQGVCRAYAKQHDVSEFKEINNAGEDE